MSTVRTSRCKPSKGKSQCPSSAKTYSMILTTPYNNSFSKRKNRNRVRVTVQGRDLIQLLTSTSLMQALKMTQSTSHFLSKGKTNVRTHLIKNQRCSLIFQKSLQSVPLSNRLLGRMKVSPFLISSKYTSNNSC